MHSDEFLFLDELEPVSPPPAEPGVTEVPEEDSFVCPGQPAKKTPPPKKRLQDWLQIDTAPLAAARMLQVTGLARIQCEDPPVRAPRDELLAAARRGLFTFL